MGRNVMATSVFKPAAFFIALLLTLIALYPALAPADEQTEAGNASNPRPLMTLNPAQAPAEAEWIEVDNASSLSSALSAGGYIRLTGDITGGPFNIPSGKEATIDLNGHTIDRSLNAAAGNGYVIQVNGALTVTDMSSGQDGQITGGWNNNGFGGAVDVVRGASFTLEGGSITRNAVSKAEGFGGGVFVDSGATFTMTGGEISYCSAGSDGNTSKGMGGGVAVAGTFEMTGGFIYECGILNDKLSSTAYGAAVAVVEGGTFILDGGTLGADKNGTLYGNQANIQGGAVYVQKRADNAEDTSAANIFEFKSGTITSSSASGSGAGAVYNGDTFGMTGGTIEQTTSGPAVVVDRNGTSTMSGGTMQKNSATGVVVNSGGTFAMTGGSISENTGAFGGGVRVNGGEFNLSGGGVVYNSANSAGGGVYISPDNSEYGLVNGGTFNMTGGTIAYNKVTGFHNTASIGYGNGGGVWVGNGTFNLSGGIIVNNQSALVTTDGGHASLGGGVWVENAGSFKVSGAPAVQDNTVGSSTFTSNVKLSDSARISIDGNLNSARIGVTPFASVGGDWGNNAVGEFRFKQGSNDNIFSAATVSEASLSNFTSDVEDYKVVRHSGSNHAQLLYHAHTITYTAEGNTLTAECTGCGEKAELTLFVFDNLVDDSNTKAYFGDPGLNAINALTKKGISQNDIEYYEGSTKLEHMPTSVGDYTAKFILTVDDDDYTIEQNFTIDHLWDDGTVTQPATMEADGVKTYTCLNNPSHTRTETIPKLPSVLITVVGSTIDGTEVAEDYTVRVAPGTTLQSINQSNGAAIIGHFTKTDDGLIPFDGRTWITTKPLSGFSSYSDVYRDYQANVAKPINEDTELYLAIAKTIDTMELSAEAPVCGTEVVYDYNGTNTGKPVITLKGNGQVTIPTNAGFAGDYPRWVDENDDPLESATIKGGDTYTAFAMVDPAFGYQFVDGAQITLSVDGAVTGTAQIVEESLAPDFPEYMRFKFNVKAVHEADEGTVTTEPTCTTPGVRTFFCKHNGKVWHGADVTLSTEEIPIDPDAHDWGAPEYIWEEENSAVKATHVCTRDAGHSETETVGTTWTVTKPATCEAKGEKTYTSNAFTNTAFEIQTKLVEIDALDHDWAEPTYEWNDDLSQVTAKRVCRHDASHVETETVGTTSEVTKEAAEEEDGERTYTSSAFANPAFTVQTKTETIPALEHEHDWGEPTYTWSDDKSKVTASRTCKKNADHEETETVDATSEITTNPTCTGKGERTYTAAFTNAAFETQTAKEDVAPKGHTAGEPVDENVVAATCETAGSCEEVVYCSVCGEELSREAKTIDALGHDWGEGTITTQPTCTEAGVKTFTCAHDASHVKTEAIDALGHDWGDWIVTKEPTEDAKGEETRTCKRCSEKETRPIDKLEPKPASDPDPDPDSDAISYRNTKGDGNVWTKGSGVTSDFTFKRSKNDAETFSHFIGIQVDGKDVGKSNYTAESGSVIVKLKPAYLETLALGEHTITALFDGDKTASADFTVVAKKDVPEETQESGDRATPAPASKVPNTGDHAPIAFLCMLALLAAGAALAVRARRA